MLRVKVLMSPRIEWMRVFDDFKKILKDAIFEVIGDLFPREKIAVESDYDDSATPKVIVKMYWKSPWKPSPYLGKKIAVHTLVRVSVFIAANVPHVVTDVKIHAFSKD